MPQAASQHSVTASACIAKENHAKPSRRKTSEAVPGALIVSAGQAKQDVEIFALAAQIKEAEARWSAACATRDERMARFEIEFPKPDIKNFAVDAFIDGLKRCESNNDVATKFFEIGGEIRQKIEQEEKLRKEARAKLQAELDESCQKALEDREKLIEQLTDCEAATLKGVCGKIDAIDYDNVEGGDPAEISLLKSIFADIQALSP